MIVGLLSSFKLSSHRAICLADVSKKGGEDKVKIFVFFQVVNGKSFNVMISDVRKPSGLMLCGASDTLPDLC